MGARYFLLKYNNSRRTSELCYGNPEGNYILVLRIPCGVNSTVAKKIRDVYAERKDLLKRVGELEDENFELELEIKALTEKADGK